MNRLLLALMLSLGALSGCAETPAWDRGTLATTRMRLDPDPDEAALVVSRRRVREEGVVGGFSGGPSSGGGGGCGCN